MGTESLAEHILVGLEGNVADEEGVGLWVLLVTVGLGAGVGTLSWSSVVAWGGEVDVGLTTIDQSTLLGSKCLRGIGRVGEFNVTEALGAAGLAVRDDAGTGDLTELLKLAVQPLVINVPGKVTDEEVLGTSIGGSLSLDLLDGGLLLLVIGLALLGWSGLLSAGLLRIGAVGIRVRTGLRIGARLGLGRLLGLRLAGGIGGVRVGVR